MKNFNFKKLFSWLMTAVAITQICTMVLLIATGNINYLYGAVALLVCLVCAMLFFNDFMED
jgi:Ca2+/H+ antiporter